MTYKVEALRTDSWLGIEAGEVYTATRFQMPVGVDRYMVSTDGYRVLFNRKYFKHIKEATTSETP